MYLKLLESPPYHSQASACHECPADYTMITERHVQAMWLEQKYFKNLTTTAGHSIEVVSPGIWNAEAGPDFLKAHLRINGADLLGDIEIHLSDESWYTHDHHNDSAYDHVVLHIGYWSPKKNVVIKTSQGHTVTTTHLEKFLTVPEARILKLIDLDLYPYHRFAGSGRCADALFSTLPIERTAELLSSAALHRLKQKWLYIEAKMEERSDLLIGGIAAALGYKHNSAAFLEVYKIISAARLQNEQEIFAEALALCGFFQSTYRERWFLSPYYQRLAATHDATKKARPLLHLQLDHIRPANHPVRRLAYMSALVANKEALQNLPRQIEELWNSSWSLGEWKVIKEQLYTAIPHFDNTYWPHHYAFEEKEQPKAISWMGEELKREIVINVLLPFLYSKIEGRGNSDEIVAFINFYGSLSATQAKKTSYLKHRFFGDDKKEALMDRADMQQGAYQIHKDFCIHYEASCEGCPFVNKHKGMKN